MTLSRWGIHRALWSTHRGRRLLVGRGGLRDCAGCDGLPRCARLRRSLRIGHGDSDVEQNMPLIRHLFGDTSTEQLASSLFPIWTALLPPGISSMKILRAGATGTSVQNRRAVRLPCKRPGTSVGIPRCGEDHTSLVTGFGLPGDLVTERVQDFWIISEGCPSIVLQDFRLAKCHEIATTTARPPYEVQTSRLGNRFETYCL